MRCFTHFVHFIRNNLNILQVYCKHLVGSIAYLTISEQMMNIIYENKSRLWKTYVLSKIIYFLFDRHLGNIKISSSKQALSDLRLRCSYLWGLPYSWFAFIIYRKVISLCPVLCAILFSPQKNQFYLIFSILASIFCPNFCLSLCILQISKSPEDKQWWLFMFFSESKILTTLVALGYR